MALVIVSSCYGQCERKKITVCNLQLLIPTHFINYSEFRQAGYLISFSNAKKKKLATTMQIHIIVVAETFFDRNPIDSKMSSKANL